MRKIIPIVVSICLALSIPLTAYGYNSSPGHEPETVPIEEKIPQQPKEVAESIELLPTLDVETESTQTVAEDDEWRVYLVMKPLPLESEKPREDNLREMVEKVAVAHEIQDTKMLETYYFDISVWLENVKTKYTREIHNPGMISLKVDNINLDNFVELLHFKNDQWVIVESAHVVDDTTIAFSEDEFSPFIVVANKNGKAPDRIVSPKTGDRSVLPVVVGLLVCLIGAWYCLCKTKTNR